MTKLSEMIARKRAEARTWPMEKLVLVASNAVRMTEDGAYRAASLRELKAQRPHFTEEYVLALNAMIAEVLAEELERREREGEQ